MNDSLSSLDLHHLVRELQVLVGARLDKTYQGTDERKRDLLLQCNKKGMGKLLLRVIFPGFAYLAAEKPGYPRAPGPFAVFLRKRVGNARIISVSQRGFDRILSLGLENKNGRFILLLELLPPGNALLLNDVGKIIGLLTPQRHGHRLLRGGAIYTAPPESFDTKDGSIEELTDRLLASKKDSLVKALASDLGLGGTYAEEVCVRAALDKEAKPKKAEAEQAAKAVKGLLDEKIAAFKTRDEVFPFSLKTRTTKADSSQRFPSFSAAIATIVPSFEENIEVAKQKTKKDKALDVVQQQEAQLAASVKSAEENQAKGEAIYNNYQQVDALLTDIRQLHKERGWKAVKEKYARTVVSIDENKGTLTIELE